MDAPFIVEPCATAGTDETVGRAGVMGGRPFTGEMDDDLACCTAGAIEPTATGGAAGGGLEPVAISGDAAGFLLAVAPTAEAYDGTAADVEF